MLDTFVLPMATPLVVWPPVSLLRGTPRRGTRELWRLTLLELIVKRCKNGTHMTKLPMILSSMLKMAVDACLVTWQHSSRVARVVVNALPAPGWMLSAPPLTPEQTARALQQEEEYELANNSHYLGCYGTTACRRAVPLAQKPV